MISFLPINQLITIISFAASVIIHCILTIIIYYHFDNKEKLIIKNYNIFEVQILAAPKRENKKSNNMNKTQELNQKKEDIKKKISKQSTTVKKIIEDKINEKKEISKHAIIENNNKLKQKKINKQKDYKNPKVEKQNLDNKATSILKKSSPKKNISNLEKVYESEEIKKKTSKKTAINQPAENNNTKALEDYKNYLTQTIQKEATENYPRVSIKRREEGKVEIIFSLSEEGKIKEINIGSKTDASKRIINSLIKILKNKIVNFEKNEILKKTNTFSIIIVYKLR